MFRAVRLLVPFGTGARHLSENSRDNNCADGGVTIRILLRDNDIDMSNGRHIAHKQKTTDD